MAGGVRHLNPVLDWDCASGVDILELSMALQQHAFTRSPICQPDDRHENGLKGGFSTLPTGWKLTKEQQDFIALFSEEDHKNNKR